MRNYYRVTTKQLGELLIERGIINQGQLERAIDYQKKHPGPLLGEILVDMNYAAEQDIVQAITAQYGFPYLPLGNYEIEQEIIASLPENICREFCLIPIDKIGKSLTIAMSNPLNTQVIQQIEQTTGCMVQVFVSTATDIKKTIDKYYKSS